MKTIQTEPGKAGSWAVRCLVFFLFALFVAGPALSIQDKYQDLDAGYGAAEARKFTQRPEHWITADHSKFEILDQKFSSGPEVTEACLSCHNQAAEQIHHTIHWLWICPADPNREMGKHGLTYNNF